MKAHRAYNSRYPCSNFQLTHYSFFHLSVISTPLLHNHTTRLCLCVCCSNELIPLSKFFQLTIYNGTLEFVFFFRYATYHGLLKSKITPTLRTCCYVLMMSTCPSRRWSLYEKSLGAAPMTTMKRDQQQMKYCIT